MIRIDEDQNGREIELPVGGQFVICLPENRTTGYRWVLESTGAPCCRPLEDTYEPGGDVPGRAGTHRWTVEAVEPGGATVELACRRPWEAGEPPARVFAVHVRVTS